MTTITDQENGNGNDNGNGHQKPLQLAPIKTAEQLAAEATRKIAPEIRRGVHFAQLPAAAKFFFDALLDLSFMHCYGGSGRGKIFITIQDLSRLLRHHKDSIAKWRDILEEARLIWVREGWPKTEWRICALCAPPDTDYKIGEYATILGRAAALAPEKTSLESSRPPFLPKPDESPRVSEGIRGGQPETTDPAAYVLGSRSLDLRKAQPNLPAGNGGRTRLSQPRGQAEPAGVTGQHQPKGPAGGGGGSAANKESPGSIGGTGDSKCVGTGSKTVTTHTIPRFEPLDRKVFARIRRQDGQQMIDFCKGKIAGLEQSRAPVPGEAEIVAAYKQRIKDVRNWIEGVL